MVKRLLFFTIALVFFQLTEAYAQITSVTVDPGPYTPGSSIAATFSLGGTCINPGNRFDLYLVRPDGTEIPTPIGSYNGFYSTFVNGTIPDATIAPPGTGYKLRIKSTNPVLTSNDSGPIEITAGLPINPQVDSRRLNAADPSAFGFCTPRTSNAELIIENQSSAGGTVTAQITNELTQAQTLLSFGTPLQSFTPDLAHYTMLVKVVMPNGFIATRAYFIINNPTNIAFRTTTTGLVCLPEGTLVYGVETSNSGVGLNFPGNLYRVSWGDNLVDTYTLCQLKSGIVVEHKYTTSSCGRNYNDGSTIHYNVFGVNISMESPLCGPIGSPLSTFAKVIHITENRFSGPQFGCINRPYTFENNSITGENPSSNTPGCEDPDVRYNWYLNGNLVAANRLRSDPYIFPATSTPGLYTIRLTSTGGSACPSVPVTQTICIQAPPLPAFDITSGTTGCAPFTVNVQDRSDLDMGCSPPSAYTYNWIVTDANGIEFTDFTDGIPNPQFSFNTPGVYTIALEITSGSCGAFRAVAPDPIVIINGPAVAILSPDRKLCTLRTYKFDAVPNTETTTILTGTQVTLSDTYTWEVTHANGNPLTAADYSFEDGTGPNSKYPSINFKQNIPYRITVTHKNTCNPAGVTDSQILEFFPAPIINAGNAQTICFTQNIVQLSATNTGTIRNQRWVGGLGTFSDRADPNATYIPTPQERLDGEVVLNFSAETDLAEPCSTVTDEVTITIKKEILVTSSPTKSICTNTRVDYAPTSNLQNTSYTWTVSGTANASGYNDSPVPKATIEDILVNTDPENDATVTYIITPINDGCPGADFTLTVTVTPRPIILTAVPARPTICSGESTNITLTSNLPNTRYTWTSTVSGTVTGNDDASPTPVATTVINNTLTNIGTTRGSVTYLITPHSAAGCPGTPVIVTINVDPEVTASNAGTNASICDVGAYTLAGNPAKSNETGTWAWVPFTGQSGVTIQGENLPNAVVNGLVAGQDYVFTWTISAPGECNPSSSSVTITVNPPTIAGTIDGTRTVCTGANNGNLNLTGNTGAVLYWESSTDGGTTWQAIANTTATLTYTNLTTATQYRAVVKNGSCSEKRTNIITITVTSPDTQANAGPPQVLCNQTATTLDGNLPNTANGESGLWTVSPATPNLQIADPSNAKTQVTDLTIGQAYIFTWTITGPSACGPSSSTVEIRVLPPINDNTISTNTVVCSGQQILVDGSVPTGGDGTYTYTWEMLEDNGVWTLIPNATGEDLTTTLNNTLATSTIVRFRRNVSSGQCASTSNEFPVTVQPPIANNTVAADQPICSGSAPAMLTGSMPTGGDGQFLYQWQSSPDGTTWTDIPGALAQNYQPPILTETTFYRRRVGTLACSGSFQSASAPVRITVNPNAQAEFTWGTSDTGCAPYALPIVTVPYPDRNATYTWSVNDVVIPSTGSTFPGYTIPSSNQSVTIKLVVTSSLGCAPHEFEHRFSTNQAVPPSFTPVSTTDCGPLAVNFVNTSNLNAGATFRWNFGNGQTSNNTNPPTITFQPDPSGKDTTYTVTLYSITTCGVDSAKGTVLVKSGPKPVFSPSTTSGCSPLPVSFTNNSPLQTGIEYFFDFGDGSAVVRTTDRSTVTHTYRTTTNTQTFNAMLTAVNQCGTVTTLPYAIVVRPNTVNAELVVNGNQLRGCAPFSVTFDNNSTGATDFIVDFNDGTQPRQSIIFPERFVHTFTAPGTYVVTLTATNGCSTNSTTETITVLPQPLTEFEADNTLGCPGLIVKFTNNTQNGVSYIWDFGDGSPISNEFEPTHTYTGDQEYYTVTLTATNNLGCTMAVTKNQYIHIVQPPVAAFNVNPSTLINIPDYTFRFEDESTNTPTIWEWDFGDGTGSALKNPSHTYLDTGTYKVTLRVLNQQGCFTSTFKNVTIKGVPGYLFVPNSFVPGNTQPELREFRAKGSGIATWRFSVFNKWGQLLWETTKLEEGRPVEGWDGTYKGQQLPQGVYFWKADVRMVNGSEWKGMTYDSSPPRRTGPIHLIR